MEQFNVSHGPTNTILIMKKSLCVDILSLEIWGQKAKKQRTSVLDIIYSLPSHIWENFSATSKFPVILRWEGWTEHKDDSIIVLSWKVIRWSELKWIGPTSPAGEIHESLALTRNHKCAFQTNISNSCSVDKLHISHIKFLTKSTDFNKPNTFEVYLNCNKKFWGRF